MDPFQAIDHFFGDVLKSPKCPFDSVPKINWDNHKYSCCWVILDLYSSLANKSIVTLLIEA